MQTLVHKLNARVVGKGDTAIVLSHGFGTDQSVWEPLLPALAARYGVLLYDLASAPTAHPDVFDLRRHGEMAGYADDLAMLMRWFGIDRCHFVGHSMSGMLGLVAGSACPERFQSLFLIGASARYVDEDGYRGGFSRADVLSMLDAIAADFHGWTSDFAPMVLGRAADDLAAQTFLGSLRRMRPDIALLTRKSVLFGDCREKLPLCGLPALVLQSRDDVAVPLEAAVYLVAHLPRARLELIDAEGHLPHLTDPALVQKALLAHLERCEGAGPPVAACAGSAGGHSAPASR